MADDDLRALERRVLSDGDATERLRLARSLERAGRRDDALEALLPGRDAPGVRLELARYPAWSHPDGGAGLTRYLDLPPVRHAPRIKWVAKRRAAGNRHLLVSPLGIVYSGASGQWGWTRVLDPETGEIVHRLKAGPACALARETILTRGWDRTAIDGHDPRTGEAVHHGTKTRTMKPTVLVAGDLLITATKGLVSCYSFPDARAKPTPIWERRFTAPMTTGKLGSVAVAADLVLVPTKTSVTALDVATGEERFQVPGRAVMADGSGFIVDERRRLVLRDLTGTEIWSVEGATPIALAPTFVLAAHLRSLSIALLDRSQGRVLGELPPLFQAVAVARDVVYMSATSHALDIPDGLGRPPPQAALEAFSAGGQRLWSLRSPETMLQPEDAYATELLATMPPTKRPRRGGTT